MYDAAAGHVIQAIWKFSSLSHETYETYNIKYEHIHDVSVCCVYRSNFEVNIGLLNQLETM